MPRENTHLFFSDDILPKIKDKELKNIIKKNKQYYYFGSFFPDVFYYSKNKADEEISDYFHSRDGNLTNEIIFDWLDLIKKTKKEQELAFVFGVLTHYALDSTLHPIVYYLSGNYHDKDPRKREQAVYLHQQLETSLDKKLNDKFSICDSVSIKKIQLENFGCLKLVAKKFKRNLGALINDVKRQLFFNKLFRSIILFKLLYFLNKIGLFKNKIELSLFYGNLKKDKTEMDDNIDYRGILSGEAKKTTLKSLFNSSEELTINMINSAYSYYLGRISRQECAKVIDGRSLNTGKIGIPVKDIKFTKFS